jgi:hypothetical protein
MQRRLTHIFLTPEMQRDAEEHRIANRNYVEAFLYTMLYRNVIALDTDVPQRELVRDDVAPDETWGP